MSVGALSAASATLFQITTFFVAGLLSTLGSSAVAAYGAANRLEMLQYPITFAFGSAVITMVATAAGARDFDRARSVAWTGAAVAAAIGLLFTAVALFGAHWMGLFTSDPAIRDMGALYLLCQAAGVSVNRHGPCLLLRLPRASAIVSGPFVMAAVRLILIVLGCWLALSLTGNAVAAFVSHRPWYFVLRRRPVDPDASDVQADRRALSRFANLSQEPHPTVDVYRCSRSD